MPRFYGLGFLLILLVYPVSAIAGPVKWPGGAKGAVSLSYDDTLESQLNHAVPVLNRYKIKASFYLLLASPVVAARMDEWRAVAKSGHELGNHTIFHPCSRAAPNREWVPAYHDLDKRTVAQMKQEVLTANAFLKAIDGRSERTFTPPCIESKVADGHFFEAVEQEFVAIKGMDHRLPEGFHSYMVPDGVSGGDLIKFVEDATRNGGVANIIFHGVGGDYLTVSEKAHAELVKHLADNRKLYWTDTYLNIMKHVNGAIPAKPGVIAPGT